MKKRQAIDPSPPTPPARCRRNHPQRRIREQEMRVRHEKELGIEQGKRAARRKILSERRIVAEKKALEKINAKINKRVAEGGMDVDTTAVVTERPLTRIQRKAVRRIYNKYTNNRGGTIPQEIVERWEAKVGPMTLAKFLKSC